MYITTVCLVANRHWEPLKIFYNESKAGHRDTINHPTTTKYVSNDLDSNGLIHFIVAFNRLSVQNTYSSLNKLENKCVTFRSKWRSSLLLNSFITRWSLRR